MNKFTMYLIVILLMFISCSYNTIKTGTIITGNRVRCTLVYCNCCNDCEVSLYLKTRNDTIQLFGTVYSKGYRCSEFKCDTIENVFYEQELTCKGKQCEEMNCSPYKIDKKYILKGYFITEKERSHYKKFNVIKYHLLEDIH